MTRAQRRGPASTPRPSQQSAGPEPSPELHSGEGAASALETLHKLERSRQFPAAAPDPGLADDPEPSS